MNAIVYTSNTGTTEAYAKLLGERTGLPVYPLNQAERAVPAGAEILYLGWLMAGGIKGYPKANKRYVIRAVCAVGMGATGTQIEEVRRRNHIPEDFPLFTLQGGFDLNRLHGVNKMMMNVMIKTVGKGLADKKDRTPDEEQMLDMVLHGGNYVSEGNLEAVCAWYQDQKRAERETV